MLVVRFLAHQGMDHSQHDQSQHHDGIGIGPGSRSMPEIPHRDRRRGLDTSGGKITERSRMRGTNALCDLAVFGLAPPNLTSSQVGKSGTMTNGPATAW